MKKFISKEEFFGALNKGDIKLDTKSLFQPLHALQQDSEEGWEEILDTFFQQVEIELEVDRKELRRIPKSGTFITISNNPFGFVDFVSLMKVVRNRRFDFKIYGEHVTGEEVLDHFIAEESNSFEESIQQAIKEGHGIGLFPSGDVESFYTDDKEIADRQWDLDHIAAVKKAGVPIIPIYIQGQNDLFFHLMKVSNGELDLNEWISEGPKKLRVIIGNPISAEEQNEFKDFNRFSRFLRVKTMMLGCRLESEITSDKIFAKKQLEQKPVGVEEIIPAVSLELIQQELDNSQDQLVVENGPFQVYICSARRVPNILQEIGRLREITFRAVGEGTNKALDLDEYDMYYHHLFVWDKENNSIVGAYRIGKGEEIMNKYGIKGFYTSSLFQIDEKFSPYLIHGCELGRSFVRQEYQLKRLPLFLLWQGLLMLMLSENHYQYLLGPVSISNEYTTLSKSLIAEFVKKFYFDHDLAKFIQPLNEFKVQFDDFDHEPLWDFTGDDFQRFDKLIGDVDPVHHGVPILLKKYIKQNGKILAFNVDPDFNDALDGFLLLNMQDVPQEQIDDLKKNIEM
ncbi:lysophospholipid acyltransferase family protein [Persicobacter sp. CCB-QB2]|uniref:lysophospholipid acyltransferase family protein n=1 Tax=Persicobacter sp. CCB-QB2 TaxID=1561025 RepID=UPI0006A96099|nr:lysophospholipid acyltransferase family protein [Persicobacter sp. CCB-QB2]